MAQTLERAARGLGDAAGRRRSPNRRSTSWPTLLAPGDIIIDGGNTYYKDDIRRAKSLEATGIHYVDVGTSGGVWGLERGYCMMIGGPKAAVDTLDPIFATLAPGVGDIPRTPGRDGARSARRAGLYPCRAVGRRALRQDGA